MKSFTSFGDVIRAILRRWPLVMVIAALGVPVAIWVALSRPDVYRAYAVVQIEPSMITDTGESLTASREIEMIERRVMARENVLALIDEFDLFQEIEADAQQIAAFREAARIEMLVDMPLDTITPVRPSGLTIRVEMEEAQLAADVANALLADVLDEAGRRTNNRVAVTLDLYSEEAERLRSEIEAVESDLAAYQAANSDALPATLEAQRVALIALTDQRIELERELIALDAENERLRPLEVERRRALITAQQELLDQRLAESNAAIAAGPEVQRQIGVYERTLTRLRDEYSVVNQRRAEAAMTELVVSQSQSERPEVLETAIAPDDPTGPRRRTVAAAVSIGIAGAGIVLALLLEMIGGKIRTAAHLERQLGVSPVIVMPLLRRRRFLHARRRLAALAALVLTGAGIAAWVTRRERPSRPMPSAT